MHERGLSWSQLQNRAAGAQFWPTQCGGVRFQVEEIPFGRHTLGLRWWGGAIRQCMRGDREGRGGSLASMQSGD